MKSGFLNTSRSSDSRSEREEKASSNTTHTPTTVAPTTVAPSMFVPTMASLKGLKKGVLKNQIIDTSEHANMHISEMYYEAEKLKSELKKAEARAKKAEARAEKAEARAEKAAGEVESTKNKAFVLAKRSMYFENLDVIPVISVFCKSSGYQLSFDSRAIIVTFGTLPCARTGNSAGISESNSASTTAGKCTGESTSTGESTTTGERSKYGVWIRDTGASHAFEIRPYFAGTHSHLKDVPCSGRRVIGNDSVIATLKDFASREDEFASGAHQTFNGTMGSLSSFGLLDELMNYISRNGNRSDDE
jgi:hypothetical protein